MYYCKRDLIFIWTLNINLLQLCASPLSIFAFNKYLNKLVFWQEYLWQWYVLNQYWGTLLGKKFSVHNSAYSQQKPNIKSSAYPIPHTGLQFKRPPLSPCLCQTPHLILGNSSHFSSLSTHGSSRLAARPEPKPPTVTVPRCFPRCKNMGTAAEHSTRLQICAFNWGWPIQVKITARALKLLWFIWFNLNYLAQVSKSKLRTHLHFLLWEYPSTLIFPSTFRSYRP